MGNRNADLAFLGWLRDIRTAQERRARIATREASTAIDRASKDLAEANDRRDAAIDSWNRAVAGTYFNLSTIAAYVADVHRQELAAHIAAETHRDANVAYLDQLENMQRAMVLSQDANQKHASLRRKVAARLDEKRQLSMAELFSKARMS